MVKNKLVYIKWVDSSHPYSGGWYDIEDVEEFDKGDHTIEQVGWIIKESKTEIILSSMVSFENDNYAHLQRLPKKMIKERKKLKI